MIGKPVRKQDFESSSEIRQNLQYWLSRPPEERLAAVDDLRREYYGDTQRLQRVNRVINREDFITNKRATSKKRADDIKYISE